MKPRPVWKGFVRLRNRTHGAKRDRTGQEISLRTVQRVWAWYTRSPYSSLRDVARGLRISATTVHRAVKVLTYAGYVTWEAGHRTGATVHVPCYEVSGGKQSLPWPTRGYTKWGTPRKERPLLKSKWRRRDRHLHYWKVRAVGEGCWAVRGHVDGKTVAEQMGAYTGNAWNEPSRVLHEWWHWSPKERVYIEMPTGEARGTFAVTVGEWEYADQGS